MPKLTTAKRNPEPESWLLMAGAPQTPDPRCEPSLNPEAAIR